MSINFICQWFIIDQIMLQVESKLGSLDIMDILLQITY
jgi:hypothetical protein